MAELHCTVEKILHPEDASVTVGERFALDCQGEMGALDAGKAELRLEPADKYKLKLLRTQSEGAAKVRLEVLSDQVGKHDFKSLSFFTGSQSLPITGLSFEVKSVQDPQAPVTEPYGPLGPLMISVPWYHWMALLMFISLLGLSITLFIFRRVERRRLMREILQTASSAQPDDELFQKLRGFQRNWDFIVSPSSPVTLENSKEAVGALLTVYQLYLSRQFNLPASRWPLRTTLRVLKSENKDLSSDDYQGIRKVLLELDRSQSAVLHARDLTQFMEWIRESVSQISANEVKKNG